MLLWGGYIMTLSDAKVWASRMWPELVTSEDQFESLEDQFESLPNAVNSANRRRPGGGNSNDLKCIPVVRDNQKMFFIMFLSYKDPRATLDKYDELSETQSALMFKAKLFAKAKDLLEKVKWTTHPDPEGELAMAMLVKKQQQMRAAAAAAVPQPSRDC